MSAWISLRNRIFPPSRKTFKKHINNIEKSIDLILYQDSLIMQKYEDGFFQLMNKWQKEQGSSIQSTSKTGYPSLDSGYGEKCYAQLNDLNFEIIVHRIGDRYVSTSLKQSHVWENYESSLLYRAIKSYKHDFIVNIGANIGWYTILCGKMIEKEGKVMAIEPDPYNYMILMDNIRLNGLNNTISALNIGMGEKECQGTLYLSPDNFGDHRTFYKGRDRNKISIDISSLDHLSSQWKDYPDIVIMDTQGAEETIFSGMRNCFSLGWNPLIFFEFCPSMSPQKGKGLIDIFNSWESKRYTFYSIVASRECVEKISVEEMAAFAELNQDDTEKNLHFLDLIAVPEGVSLESLIGSE